MSVIVGEYRPLYPAPETPQYLCFDKDELQREMIVEERWCYKHDGFGTFGRANLRNGCDVHTMTFKERLVSPWDWCFIHLDGWQINFWPENFWLCRDTDKSGGESVRPIASIDVRQISVVNVLEQSDSAEGHVCPYEIHVNFQNGYFPFRVRTLDEAKEWKGRIMKGVVENVRIGQLRDKYLQNLHIHDEVEANRIERDPVRLERLGDLWHQAVEAVEKGVRPPKQVFFDMYRLYDSLDVGGMGHGPEHQAFAPAGGPMDPKLKEALGGGDHNLTMAEIEVMAREFIEMKIEEVRAVVVKQEKMLFSNHRPPSALHEVKLRWTIDQGRALLAHYEQQVNPRDFFDRVVNFHHRTDISREGRVDVAEFMNAAPVFLMPIKELRQEGLFFRAAMQSDMGKHREMEQLQAHLRKEGKSHEEHERECNQQ